MPMLVRTPEEIFRKEKRDVYCIHFFIKAESENDKVDAEDDPSSNFFDIFRAGDTEKMEQAMQEMEGWLSVNTPDSVFELMGPSEYSGIICGGPMMLEVAFTAQDLKVFEKRWENGSGKSVDARFQCYIYPYDRWLAQHGSYIPKMDKPKHIGVTYWFDTPLGIVYHQISNDRGEDESISSFPGSPEDVWMHARQIWPQLAEMDCDRLLRGEICRVGHDGSWHVSYLGGLFAEGQEDRLLQIIKWFGLPDSTPCNSYY